MLVRLFLLGTSEPRAAVETALPPVEGLLERDGTGLRAALDVRSYGADDGHWWVVSDLGTDLRPPPAPGGWGEENLGQRGLVSRSRRGGTGR